MSATAYSGSEGNARAFNAGADARLRGEPLEACPWGMGGGLGFHWRSGWLSVHREWGCLAHGAVKPLPTVQEPRSAG